MGDQDDAQRLYKSYILMVPQSELNLFRKTLLLLVFRMLPRPFILLKRIGLKVSLLKQTTTEKTGV